MVVFTASAPAKVNLCLFVGTPRSDGLHPLVSLVQPLSLADRLELAVDIPGIEQDEVICPGIEGPNLAAAALAAYRAATDCDLGPVRLTISKRIPVAAGMGGGSADAAAALRLIAHAAGRPDDPILPTIAPRLGADVSVLLLGERAIMTGAGERVQPLGIAPKCAFVIVKSTAHLPTQDVYNEFDRCTGGRPPDDLEAIDSMLRSTLRPGVTLPGRFTHNDLAEPARRLCPAITQTLVDVVAAGADTALVSGSGPTVFGAFYGAQTKARAQAAAVRLGDRAIIADPVGPDFAAIERLAR